MSASVLFLSEPLGGGSALSLVPSGPDAAPHRAQEQDHSPARHRAGQSLIPPQSWTRVAKGENTLPCALCRVQHHILPLVQLYQPHWYWLLWHCSSKGCKQKHAVVQNPSWIFGEVLKKFSSKCFYQGPSNAIFKWTLKSGPSSQPVQSWYQNLRGSHPVLLQNSLSLDSPMFVLVGLCLNNPFVGLTQHFAWLASPIWINAHFPRFIFW